MSIPKRRWSVPTHDVNIREEYPVPSISSDIRTILVGSKLSEFEVTSPPIAIGPWWVYLKAWSKALKANVVLKKVDLILLRMQMQQSEERKFLENELSVHDMLSNCTTVLEYYSHFKDRDSFYIVMEYAEWDISTYMRTHGILTEKECAMVTLQVAIALHFLHHCGISHTRLNSTAVFVSKDMSQRDSAIVARISDFGNALPLAVYDEDRVLLGTIRDRLTGVAADIWDLGVLVFYCLTGMEYCTGIQLADHLSGDSLDFVCKLLSAASISSMEDIARHKWIQNLTGIAHNCEKSCVTAERVASLNQVSPFYFILSHLYGQETSIRLLRVLDMKSERHTGASCTIRNTHVCSSASTPSSISVNSDRSHCDGSIWVRSLRTDRGEVKIDQHGNVHTLFSEGIRMVIKQHRGGSEIVYFTAFDGQMLRVHQSDISEYPALAVAYEFAKKAQSKLKNSTPLVVVQSPLKVMCSILHGVNGVYMNVEFKCSSTGATDSLLSSPYRASRGRSRSDRKSPSQFEKSTPINVQPVLSFHIDLTRRTVSVYIPYSPIGRYFEYSAKKNGLDLRDFRTQGDTINRERMSINIKSRSFSKSWEEVIEFWHHGIIDPSATLSYLDHKTEWYRYPWLLNALQHARSCVSNAEFLLNRPEELHKRPRRFIDLLEGKLQLEGNGPFPIHALLRSSRNKARNEAKTSQSFLDGHEKGNGHREFVIPSTPPLRMQSNSRVQHGGSSHTGYTGNFQVQPNIRPSENCWESGVRSPETSDETKNATTSSTPHNVSSSSGGSNKFSYLQEFMQRVALEDHLPAFDSQLNALRKIMEDNPTPEIKTLFDAYNSYKSLLLPKQ